MCTAVGMLIACCDVEAALALRLFGDEAEAEGRTVVQTACEPVAATRPAPRPDGGGVPGAHAYPALVGAVVLRVARVLVRCTRASRVPSGLDSAVRMS